MRSQHVYWLFVETLDASDPISESKMNYSIQNINKINFEAPFINVSLVSLLFESRTNYSFEEIALNFIHSKLECETLYKFENRRFDIQNGCDKDTYACYFGQTNNNKFQILTFDDE